MIEHGPEADLHFAFVATRVEVLTQNYSEALESIADEPAAYKISHLMARLFFRGIYFPQMGRLAWVRVITQNRRTIFKLVKEGFGVWCRPRSRSDVTFDADPEVIHPN